MTSNGLAVEKDMLQTTTIVMSAKLHKESVVQADGAAKHAIMMFAKHAEAQPESLSILIRHAQLYMSSSGLAVQWDILHPNLLALNAVRMEKLDQEDGIAMNANMTFAKNADLSLSNS